MTTITSSPTETLPRSLWWQVIILVLVALALRTMFPAVSAVEHFDEGVYASNLLFDAREGGAYPARHLYAPPLVPAIIEWSMIFFGTGAVGTMLPNMVMGALTVLLTWRVARHWFGEEAALPAMVIAAASDFHIVYSRTALTDVWLAAFTLLAVSLGTEAIRKRSAGRAVLAGLATGVAWWSKYNGWLALAIVGAGTTVWIARHRSAAHPRSAITCFAIMTVTACLAWSPVVWTLQDHGGYGAVAANHAGYLVGIGGWLNSARQQLGAHRVLDSWLSWLTPGAAIIACAIHLARSRSFTWNESANDFAITPALILKLSAGALLLTLLAAAGVGTTAVLLCVALGGVSGRIRWPALPRTAPEACDREALAQSMLPCWITIAWLLGLLIATPAYRPYPRLTLPLLVGIWLGASAGVAWWVRANLRWHGRRGVDRPVAAHNLTLIVLILAALGVLMDSGRLAAGRRVAGWQPRTSLQELATRIRDELVDDPTSTIVYTYGEPALFFHLNQQGVTARPVTQIPAPGASRRSGVTVLLVEGPRARDTDEFVDDWVANMRHFEVAASYQVLCSDLVLLNQFSANQLQQGRPSQTYRIYRLRTP